MQPTGTQCITVLLVEDDRLQSRLVESVLSKDAMPHAVTVATTLEEALDRLRSDAWDAVLLDLHLPDSQGLETLDRVLDAAPDIPVVVLTSTEDAETGIDVVHHGAQDFLTKTPASYGAVARVIRYAMERHVLRRSERRAWESLHDVHRETRRILDAIPSILIGVDAMLRLSWWNDRAADRLGLTPDRDSGVRLDRLPLEWDAARIGTAAQQAVDGEATVALDDVPINRVDGIHGILGLTFVPMVSPNDPDFACLILGSDTTERRELEAQVANLQKLEAIGQLAAGIAHEINTPTQYVSDNLSFLREGAAGILDLIKAYRSALADAPRLDSTVRARLDDLEQEADVDYLEDEIPKAIDQAMDGASRISRIVRAMKEFSHPGGDEFKPVDLNAAIDSTVTVARNEWKYVADVELDLAEDLPAVPCLPGEINQVILNLVVNAAHAIGDAQQAADEGGKGTITVRTARDGDDVVLSISDTGTGIPEDVRSRVFDPFFTTKEVGRGTGQGLSIAHSVITKKHGGSISFKTELGQGTTFFVRLPLDEDRASRGGGAR